MIRFPPLCQVGAALLALAGPAVAQAPPPASPPAATQPASVAALQPLQPLQVTPPTLEVRRHQLANGLKVLLHPDRSVPVTDVQVWYEVGSKDERAGRSGFAHLFEHLMFKGSANVGPEEHSQFVESIGGRDNATTDFDRTLYYQTVPSRYLERILWMEADRMRSLDVSDDNFKSEREVVKEERRLRVDNPPFGRLFEVVLANTYTTHPYRILPIGSIADLDAATIDDVRAFHRPYYVPKNATLVVSGDLDAEPTRAGSRSTSATSRTAPGRSRARCRRAAADRRAAAGRPPPQHAAAGDALHLPHAGGRPRRPLRPGGGEQRALRRRQLAALPQDGLRHADGARRRRPGIVARGPGVFFFYSILQGGNTPEEAEKALIAEVDRLKSEPVSAAELAKAKNQTIANLVFGRQTVADKGSALGYASVILGDPGFANRQLAFFQKVTAADVQRVAQTHFRPENRTVVTMLPEAPEAPEAPPAAPAATGAGAANQEDSDEKTRPPSLHPCPRLRAAARRRGPCPDGPISRAGCRAGPDSQGHPARAGAGPRRPFPGLRREDPGQRPAGGGDRAS